MTVHRIVLAALAVVVLVAVAPEANGKGVTPITACAQFVTTNAVLTQDLTCTGNGIFVNASQVTIDLNGHTLTSDGGPDFGVEVFPSSKVTIKNGVIREFSIGLFADNGTDHLSIVNVAVSGSSFGGFDLRGDSTSVASSSATANAGEGISVTGDAFSIKSSTTSSNGGTGLLIDGAAPKITSVISTGNGNRGIAIGGNLASVKSSTVSGNDIYGIVIFGNAAKLKGNQADGNGFQPHDASGLGIRVEGAAPVGVNVARGNDDPAECNPAFLC